MTFIDKVSDYDGAAVYALVDRNGKKYIGSSTNLKKRIAEHVRNMELILDGNSHIYNKQLTEYIQSGGTFTLEILEIVGDLSTLEDAEERLYLENQEDAIYNARKPYRPRKGTLEQLNIYTPMTITEYADRVGVRTQGLYKKLTNRGISLDDIRDKANNLITEDGFKLLNQLYSDRTQPKKQSVDKVADIFGDQLNQLKEQLSALQVENERLRIAEENSRKKIEDLINERDYLRVALNQSQQLHAMTIKALPPAPAERKGAFSWLTSRFKKPAPAADQTQTTGEG